MALGACASENSVPPDPQGLVGRTSASYRIWYHARPKRGLNRSAAQAPRLETSLIIYDDGEGQHPHDFEHTFLSLLRGNKNEIHFVQGKYNMGGAGAIAFCGQNRYQLIGSRRYDDFGDFGYTLLRRHPLTELEKTTKRNTWYEYFAPSRVIPSFSIRSLDLGLRDRHFTTGSIIKLYSYDLPKGSRSVISRDLNQSLNEYLFNPALPFFTIDRPSRYPKDKNLQRAIYGLKRRLEEDAGSYVEHCFSDTLTDSDIGSAKTTTYVFRPRVGERDVRETKKTIRQEFFKNNMSVIFSVNGQVHGHYTSEFISRTLKFQLLKDYVLIHVDCTDLDMIFRQELFMASRDRLKDGKESRELRRRLGILLKDGRLKQVYKTRKAQISVDDADADDLLRSLTSNLPFRKDLMRLFDHSLKLKGAGKGKRKKKRRKKVVPDKPDLPPFRPQRFPSFFKSELSSRANGTPMVRVPLGSKRTIRFSPELGLPKLVRVYRDDQKGDLTWEALENQGVEMDHDIVVHPDIDDDVLTNIYVNMDSSVLLNHRSSLKTQEALEVAEKRYISAVYFHTLFLYTITQNRRYTLQREVDGYRNDDVHVRDYLKDLFANHYAEFLLTFEMGQLIAALEE